MLARIHDTHHGTRREFKKLVDFKPCLPHVSSGHSSSDAVARVRKTTEERGSKAVCSGRDSAAACTRTYMVLGNTLLFFSFVYVNFG